MQDGAMQLINGTADTGRRFCYQRIIIINNQPKHRLKKKRFTGRVAKVIALILLEVKKKNSV
jgi:hypothetical protein